MIKGKYNLTIPLLEKLITNSKKLKDYGFWSYRLRDKHRIIFALNYLNSEIKILKIENRDKVYNNLNTI